MRAARWCNNACRVKPRAKWLLLTALGMGGLGVGLGIAFEPERRAPRPQVEATAPTASVAHESPLPPEPAAIDVSPAASVVADFRRRTLNPEPQDQPSSLVAISGARVGRIEPDALVVVEPGAPKKRLKLRLPGAFAVAATPGALYAVGRDQLLVLGTGESKARSVPRPSLFPRSQLMPDLIDAARIWVRHPRSNSLFGYSLHDSAATLLPLEDTVMLGGAADGSFLALADGSFLHFTGEGWERLFLRGRRTELPWPKQKAAPFRALRAQRLDQVYVLGSDGVLELFQLKAPLERVWQRDVGPLPVDIATSGDTVFLLRTERPQGGELRWTLQVMHRKRQDVSIALGSDDPEAGTFEGDWHGRLLARYGLATSPRWVALGGTGQLRVWDAKTLQPVHVVE